MLSSVVYYVHTYYNGHVSYVYSLFTTPRKNYKVCYFVFLWRMRDYEKKIYICPKLRKDKSNSYVGMKRRHLSGQNLAGIMCVSLLHVSFVVFTLFWGKRTSDKTKIIVIWQQQNEIPKWHISVTIWRWTTLFLSFIYIFQMRAKSIVRLLCGVGLSIIRHFVGTCNCKLTVLNRSAILCNQAFVASYCCFDVNFCRLPAGYRSLYQTSGL